jgi:metal-responsive CopG/Arc/MetJ family transcriptional regulator
MEHKTIKLPEDLLDNIEEIIKKNPELGYVSTPEFIKEAVRIHIKKIKEEIIQLQTYHDLFETKKD